ncbi:universal stress protein [Olivibacter sp. SDN3]|uniref:universal stress protein n=1 Tax=Olivibacter sp. SDN3 TaxID=2764720 RepID=UPI0016519B5F|nr:universal stress protein [Olivibacter sp. SDN3]QNL52004.1 universal stress protein [Olivibacter sp. SDN3]
MESILIATDFSKSANNAAEYAARLGEQLSVKNLILYHSYEPVPQSVRVPESNVLLEESIRERNLKSLDELKQELAVLTNGETNIITVTDHFVLSHGINNLTKKYDIGLVVIGLSDKSLWEKILLGSSTKEIVSTCRLPLLVVPSSSRYTPIDKIVMGCDLKKVSTTVPAEKIRELVALLNAHLLAVHVDHDEEQYFDSDIIRQQYAFYDLFEDIEPSIAYVDDQDVNRGILTYAEEQQAQMILVVAKTRSFFERLTKESISKKLATTSKFPLLIIH